VESIRHIGIGVSLPVVEKKRRLLSVDYSEKLCALASLREDSLSEVKNSSRKAAETQRKKALSSKHEI
jgi:hypothetical protein